MKTQSPGLNLKPLGLLMTRFVTFEGRTNPSKIDVLPLPINICMVLHTFSPTPIIPIGRNHFQNSGAWRMRSKNSNYWQESLLEVITVIRQNNAGRCKQTSFNQKFVENT